jgi:RHS repeat-associated protein
VRPTARDAQRRLVFAIQPNPGSGTRTATKATYDLDSELIELDKGTTTQPTGSDFSALKTTTTSFDAKGNKIEVNILNGGPGASPMIVTQMSYDADDRPQCTAIRENAAVFGALPTSACTQSTAGTYGPDQITELIYDAASQKTQEQRAVGSPNQINYATYAYTADSKVWKVTDANVNLTTYGYDGFDRLSQTTFPSATRGAGTSDPTDYEAYTYDANDNEVCLQRRDGSFVRYTYNGENLRLSKSFVSAGTANGCTTTSTSSNTPWYALNVAYTYDLLGRTLSALYPNQSGSPGVAWTWDNDGRKLSESTSGLSLSFTWDPAGNPASMTWPDTQVATYTYDSANRFTSAGVTGAASVSYSAYDSLSRVTGITRGGASSTIGYDKADRMTSLAHSFTSAGNNVAWGFTFSPASQIVGYTNSNAAFDWSAPGASSSSYSADGLNRDTAIAGAEPPGATCGEGYDCRGNLAYDGVRTFTYDGENRLLTETGPVTMALSYDPLGRLQQSVINGTTTQFLYDGDNLVAEYAAGAVLQRYVHGPGVDQPLIWFAGAGVSGSAANYLIPDRQGSIIGVANNAGALTSTYTYDPYGNPNSWTGSRFRYTGQVELQGASLYHYKARVYDPTRGWFLQTDPVGYGPDVNWYAYVHNDPVDKTDPSGETPAAAAAMLGETFELDLVEEAGGTNANPAVDIAQAVTTVGGVIYAGYKLFQPSDANNGPTTSEARGHRGGQGQGERNQAGNRHGTPNPDKHVKPGEKPGTQEVKDPHTGKTTVKPYPGDPRLPENEPKSPESAPKPASPPPEKPKSD